ncbi:MAG: penicillin-binding transpeptidase domain-containing protein, partial [Candidatus Saccharibacteria bacterium]|nr:penicillin-binding transpeptidase domain-containing protein [Candidatus Saccharibacteria bacterium]
MQQENRAMFLRRIMIVLVGVIVFRLFVIQIIEHDKYVKLAEEQQTMQNTIVADRGEIYMMDGTEPVVIAMNEQVWTVLVDPMIADAEETEKRLGPLLGEKRVAEWGDVFKDKELRYYVVARGINRDAAEKIKEEGLSGVWLQQNTRRVYPEGTLGANLLGFVDAEGNGQYGVEGAMNDRLSGENGLLKTVKDVNNIPLTIGDDNVRVPAKDGDNIVLTIDRNVQKKVEQALQHGIERSRVAHASVIVMDPRTGKVMAMAGLPSYDPANYMSVEDAEAFLNDPIQGAYEPASVCKTFAFSAAIDQGVMTPQTTYYNTGSTTVDGWPINNLHKGELGTITMQTAL